MQIWILYTTRLRCGYLFKLNQIFRKKTDKYDLDNRVNFIIIAI